MSVHIIYFATKLALKLNAHSVQYAYKVASTGCAPDKVSFNSHHRDQAKRGNTVSRPAVSSFL
eukprot:1161405-Pelagomonas_calceolata.AAC.1